MENRFATRKIVFETAFLEIFLKSDTDYSKHG